MEGASEVVALHRAGQHTEALKSVGRLLEEAVLCRKHIPPKGRVEVGGEPAVVDAALADVRDDGVAPREIM